MRRHHAANSFERNSKVSGLSRNCFAVFVKIAVVVFSHPIGIRDLSILFDDARIFGVKLRIIA